MEGLQPIERMDRKVLPSREMLLMQIPTLLSRPKGNSVCLHDFLHRIKSRDTRLMAYDLMAGDTIDEIRTYRRWSRDHTYRTYNRLRLRMEEYLSI